MCNGANMVCSNSSNMISSNSKKVEGGRWREERVCII